MEFPTKTVINAWAGLLGIAILASCSSSPRSLEPVSAVSTERPQIIAMIDGVPLTHESVFNDLSERAGQQSILDLLLDRRLEQEIQSRSIKITQEQIILEEERFFETMTELGQESRSYELLNTLRASRGLGPDRYPRFLRRNAMLRALVGENGAPDESQYELAVQLAFGESYRIRMFVTDEFETANVVRQSVSDADEQSRRWIFADACSTTSTHPSSERGGLVTDLNPVDPSYPSVMTSSLGSLKPGDLSPVLSTQAGYVVLLIEEIEPAQEPTQEQIEQVRHQLASRTQRLEMQRLSEKLINSTQVTVMDRALNWAWTWRP
jgi:PPIC-type PPIASE domain